MVQVLASRLVLEMAVWALVVQIGEGELAEVWREACLPAHATVQGQKYPSAPLLTYYVVQSQVARIYDPPCLLVLQFVGILLMIVHEVEEFV